MSLLTELLGATGGGDAAVVVAIVGARLLVPLLIPRYPLAIVVALALDAVDQTLLAELTSIDTGPDGPYQSYDKALDVYYLTVAYLSTIRNWTSDAAFRIGQFLFFYRLVGTTLFELFDERILLLIFPNTFEYFFIVYELVRLRRDPSRISARFWLLMAAGLWVLVKLPQEYWIHVAQRDVTETVRESPLLGVAATLALLALLLVYARVVRPRLPAPDYPLVVVAPPLARSEQATSERLAFRLRGRFLSSVLVEEAVLLSLLCTIFVEILPNVDASPTQVAVGITAVVCANTAVGIWAARRGGVDLGSEARRFVARLVLNVAFVVAVSGILGSDTLSLGHGVFFAYLVTLVVWLGDSYRWLRAARLEQAGHVTSLGDFVRRVREGTA